MKATFDAIAKKSAEAAQTNDRDYFNEKGLLCCGKCRFEKQCRVVVFETEYTVPCMCRCEIEERDLKEKIRQAERIADIRKNAFSDPVSQSVIFDIDDNKNSELSLAARKYAEKFGKESKWLFLYGRCGTGKSFFATCICNAVIDKGFTARQTTVSEIERELWAADNKSSVYDRLNSYDLVAIDDLFSERDTEYMNEIVYNIIDIRYRSRRPMVITSNITIEELVHPQNISRHRIYSRIYQMSILINAEGKDRRFKALKETMREEYEKLLG